MAACGLCLPGHHTGVHRNDFNPPPHDTGTRVETSTLVCYRRVHSRHCTRGPVTRHLTRRETRTQLIARQQQQLRLHSLATGSPALRRKLARAVSAACVTVAHRFATHGSFFSTDSHTTSCHHSRNSPHNTSMTVDSAPYTASLGATPSTLNSSPCQSKYQEHPQSQRLRLNDAQQIAKQRHAFRVMTPKQNDQTSCGRRQPLLGQTRTHSPEWPCAIWLCVP